jgi:hypothetical protein
MHALHSVHGTRLLLTRADESLVTPVRGKGRGPAVCAARREDTVTLLPPARTTRRAALGSVLFGVGWAGGGAAAGAVALWPGENKQVVIVDAEPVLTAEAIAAREAIEMARQEPDPEVCPSTRESREETDTNSTYFSPRSDSRIDQLTEASSAHSRKQARGSSKIGS